ncbi:MAG: DUF4404 family protein [Planctomycetaceae bacterium]
MTQDDLRKTLAALRDALSSTSEVDDETRALLQNVTREIQQVLDGERSSDSHDTSFSERVGDVLRDFDAHHPAISGLLERLSDGLSSLGI